MKKIVMLLSNAFLPDPRPYREALSLVNAGYSVKILCWDRGEGMPRQDAVNGILVERIYLRSRHGRGASQIVFLIVLWIKMLRRLARENFDLIYCHDLDTLPVGLLLRFTRKCGVVFDSHDIFSKVLGKNVPGMLRSLIAFFERYLIRRSDVVITASSSVASLYGSFGVKNIYTVENWKNLEDFRIVEGRIRGEKARLGIKDELVISYISNLGPERIIEPLLDIVSEDRNVFLIVAGEGAGGALVEKFSRSFSNIAYLGFVPYDKVCLYTALADVVYFGYNKYAPMAEFLNPNKLFEAMAAGKAFIGGDFGEMGEVIKAEQCGIALDEYSKENIREAINTMKDREKLRIFQDNARRAGAARYNWETAEKVLLDAVSKVG